MGVLPPNASSHVSKDLLLHGLSCVMGNHSLGLCWQQHWSEIAPALISAVEKKQQLEPLKYSLELYDPYNEKAEEITSDLMPTLEIDVEKEHIIRRRNISTWSRY